VFTKGSATTIGSGAAGAFTPGTSSVTITGPSDGSAAITVKTAQESAASLASAINNVSGTTGVQAQATNTVTLSLTPSSANATGGPGFSFKIQAGTGAGSANGSGIGKSQTINASSAAQVVSQINGQTSTSGITAALDTSGNLVLTQASGQNINITGITAGSLKTNGATATTLSAAGSASGVFQGQVQMQSSAAFSVKGASAIGQSASSTLTSLAAINVSTTSGANTAINVVKYALASLNNQGGQLGAVQQALSANINNLNTTSQNLTSALGVVQDANIPAVSNQLTEAEIQAQSGVAALKSSTQLQQSYLSLLP